MAARARAYEEEKTDILQDDSMKLQSLNDEIQGLRDLISAAPDSELQAQMDLKEGEKIQLDAQIAEKMAMLESVQSDLDRRSGGSSTMMVVFMSILGALVIVLVVVLVMVLMGNKNKQQAFPPPPPWMYPPRPRKKKDSPVNGESKQTATPAPQQTIVPSSIEDPSVIQSEINDMKQAVVSMSVGQPSTATKIVQDWIVTEAPAPPEPETPQAEESADGDDDGKKKKKKKKKK